MKIMNKVIATMMMMAITTAMPAMAGNKNHNDKKDKVVAVNNGKKFLNSVQRYEEYNRQTNCFIYLCIDFIYHQRSV